MTETARNSVKQSPARKPTELSFTRPKPVQKNSILEVYDATLGKLRAPTEEEIHRLKLRRTPVKKVTPTATCSNTHETSTRQLPVKNDKNRAMTRVKSIN